MRFYITVCIICTNLQHDILMDVLDQQSLPLRIDSRVVVYTELPPDGLHIGTSPLHEPVHATLKRSLACQHCTDGSCCYCVALVCALLTCSLT